MNKMHPSPFGVLFSFSLSLFFNPGVFCFSPRSGALTIFHLCRDTTCKETKAHKQGCCTTESGTM